MFRGQDVDIRAKRTADKSMLKQPVLPNCRFERQRSLRCRKSNALEYFGVYEPPKTVDSMHTTLKKHQTVLPLIDFTK
jgi:hypothetical protein